MGAQFHGTVKLDVTRDMVPQLLVCGLVFMS